MRTPTLFTVAAAAAITIAGCSSSAPAQTEPSAPAATTSLAPTTSPSTSVAEPPPAPDRIYAELAPDRLPAGTHVGAMAFSPPADGLTEPWLERWDELTDGASIGRVQLDWIDVEPAEGEYDTVQLEDGLRDLVARGQAPMLTLAAVDVSGTPFPEWLGGFEPDRAADAYNRMLDHIGPLLDEYGVWLLLVSNEPPLSDGLDRGDFAQFVQTIADHVHDTIPGLPVSVTFIGDDLSEGDPSSEELVAAVDVLAVNHYCLNSDLRVVDDQAAHLAHTVRLAPDRPVVFHELGCPAAEELGSSEEYQAAWFAETFERIDADPRLRASFLFEFSDWDEQLVSDSYSILIDEGLPELYDRLAAWLTTSGVVRSDATVRPSFAVVRAAIEASPR